MRARELAQALMSTEATDSDGPLVQALVVAPDGNSTWCWINEVKEVDFHDADGTDHIAYLVCEPVVPLAPKPKTAEEKVAFRKEWDARVDKGKEA